MTPVIILDLLAAFDTVDCNYCSESWTKNLESRTKLYISMNNISNQ